MKKFFLILLLFVLPLQMSWAAASAYCLHEEGKAAQHPGHHGHQHKAGAEPADKKSLGQPHSDCNFCHGIGQGSLPATNQLALPGPASHAIAPSSFFYASPIPDGPRRPDWTPVA